jgi:hypothetical protein
MLQYELTIWKTKKGRRGRMRSNDLDVRRKREHQVNAIEKPKSLIQRPENRRGKEQVRKVTDQPMSEEKTRARSDREKKRLQQCPKVRVVQRLK